jgi:hypothetical protein
MEPKSSLPHTQKPATGFYPGTVHNLFLQYPFKYPPSYVYVSYVVTPEAIQTKFCMHF